MYHSGGRSSKLEMPVEYPSQLKAQDICSSSNAETTALKLVALVCHYGSKLKSCSGRSHLSLCTCHCISIARWPLYCLCEKTSYRLMDLLQWLVCLRGMSIHIIYCATDITPNSPLPSAFTFFKRSWVNIYSLLPASGGLSLQWWICCEQCQLWICWWGRNQESGATNAVVKCSSEHSNVTQED